MSIVAFAAIALALAVIVLAWTAIRQRHDIRMLEADLARFEEMAARAAVAVGRRQGGAA